MTAIKSKAIRNLEEKLETADADPMRHKALQGAKNFKASWIELGQTLYAIWKDKLFRGWGFYNFDTYTQKEIGIRKQTALKLLRSYYFLEKEEPAYLDRQQSEKAGPANVPSYESVNLLRLAKNKKELDEQDYKDIKKNILEKGKDVREVKKDLTALIRQREELNPEEARNKKKQAVLKRFLSTLKSLRDEIKASKILPAGIIKDADKLIKELEDEIV
ncbi:hypothetical protein ACFL42_00815 [Candidatus Omnitrophota bacterium]